MQHHWSLEEVHLHNTWVTIGSFDGVHRGHTEIVSQLVTAAHAEQAQAVVLTFYPHPAEVLGKRNGPFYLTTPEQRATLLGDLGVDVVITHPFTVDIARLTAEEFMTNIQTHLDLRQLWVGYDFALGRGREGDVTALQILGERLGFQVHVISAIEMEGEVVSSSVIRTLLGEGKVEQAARLLGRPYSLQGDVVPGDGRGRTIGIPTANLKIWQNQVVPKTGVYVCLATLEGQAAQYLAVTNIGLRPTFDVQNPVRTIETHLLDFSADLYGQLVKVEFVARLRDEQRFPNATALVEQIHQDIIRARQIYANILPK